MTTTKVGFEEAIQAIRDDREENQKAIASLRKENAQIQDDKYKDTELLRMKLELGSLRNAMRFGFPVTEEEHAAIMKWKDLHI